MDDKVRIRAAIKRAYEEGYREGLCQRQKFLNTLKTMNQNLWQELIILDQDEPILDNTVRIPIVFAERLEKAVKEDHSGYAKLLHKLIQQKQHRFDKLLSIIESCKGLK